MKSEIICPGVIGRKMYAKSTLLSMKKEELIELLMLAELNYRSVAEAYCNTIDKNYELYESLRKKEKENEQN